LVQKEQLAQSVQPSAMRVVSQFPSMQTSSSLHRRLQPPQLSGSQLVSVQTLLLHES